MMGVAKRCGRVLEHRRDIVDVQPARVRADVAIRLRVRLDLQEDLRGCRY